MNVSRDLLARLINVELVVISADYGQTVGEAPAATFFRLKDAPAMLVNVLITFIIRHGRKAFGEVPGFFVLRLDCVARLRDLSIDRTENRISRQRILRDMDGCKSDWVKMTARCGG